MSAGDSPVAHPKELTNTIRARNMKFALHAFYAVSLVLFLSTNSQARDWKGIVPLKSTRSDVERLLGVQKRSSDAVAYYKLAKEIVVFHFQVDVCDSPGGKFGLGWNVAPGTVVNIGVIPRGKHRKEEYLPASDAKVHDMGAGIVYYSDQSAGLTVETYENLVTLVEYYPEASKENLRCPRVEACCVDFFPKIDEYGEIPFGDEKARLENFMITMNEVFGRGVIEIVGPSKRVRQERIKRAARSKSYLVKQHGLEGERLLVVDGGFSETVATRLSRYSIGGVASQIFLYPQKDP